MLIGLVELFEQKHVNWNKGSYLILMSTFNNKLFYFYIVYKRKEFKLYFAQSAGVVDYTDCTSAED